MCQNLFQFNLKLSYTNTTDLNDKKATVAIIAHKLDFKIKIYGSDRKIHQDLKIMTYTHLPIEN